MPQHFATNYAKNYQWILKAIPVCKNQLKFNDMNMKTIYDALLPNSKDLNVLLESIEGLSGLINFESSTIEESTKKIYSEDQKKVKPFVRENIHRIVKIKGMAKILNPEIQHEIQSLLGSKDPG